MPTSAFKMITPTSIAYSGGYATTNTLGQITFSTVTTLSLNGVFTSTYDNYMIVWRNLGSSPVNGNARMRASGTDNSTASSYVSQQVFVSGTSSTAARTTSTFWSPITHLDNGVLDGRTIFLFGPFLAQPTAFFTTTFDGGASGSLYYHAGTHNQSVSYDGITLYPNSGSMTGTVGVYGCNQ